MSYHNPNARFEKKREPQVRMPCLLGSMLVPTEFDALGDIPEAALAEVEKAIELIAQYLTDKDVQLFLGIYHYQGNDWMRDLAREAAALRRLPATLRAVFTGKLTTVVRK